MDNWEEPEKRRGKLNHCDILLFEQLSTADHVFDRGTAMLLRRLRSWMAHLKQRSATMRCRVMKTSTPGTFLSGMNNVEDLEEPKKKEPEFLAI
jgi:hypothetical protein